MDIGRNLNRRVMRESEAMGDLQKNKDKNGYLDANRLSGVPRNRLSRQVQEMNASTAAENFYRSRGGRSSNAYEAAEQDRQMYLDPNRMKYADARNPTQLLQDKMGHEAYQFRTGLTGMQNDAANDIRSQAGSTLDEGIRSTREGANSRGLLYSGLRQGAEQSLRGRVANAMASQISQSNRGLSQEADQRDRAAAASGTANAAAENAARSEISRANSENAIFRAQQMQQLTGAIGYGFGRMAGGKQQASGGLTGGNQSTNSRNATMDNDDFFQRLT
jgi:hypothetical protein